MEEEQNPEVKKYLEKLKQMEAQNQALTQHQAQAEQEMQMAQIQEEQMRQQQWIDSTRVMVSKSAMCDLYLSFFMNNQEQGLHAIEALCSSVTAFEGQEQEEKMLVDRVLIENLKICHENKDIEKLYFVANEILYSLSSGQRREIVRILVNDIQEHGGIAEVELINALQESVYNPMFFRC